MEHLQQLRIDLLKPHFTDEQSEILKVRNGVMGTVRDGTQTFLAPSLWKLLPLGRSKSPPHGSEPPSLVEEGLPRVERALGAHVL